MSKLFKFRKYKKKQGKKNVKHPKLIVDDYNDEYGYMGLTSSKSKGKKHNNFELIDNPQFDGQGKRLKKKSYLRRKIDYDKKDMFGNVLMNYSLSDIDESRVKTFIKNKKKKR